MSSKSESHKHAEHVVARVTPEELDRIRETADAGHMTISAYLRKLLGLPRLAETRGRKKAVRPVGRPARMKQAPLFPAVPEAPASSKRASDGAIVAADSVDVDDDKRAS